MLANSVSTMCFRLALLAQDRHSIVVDHSTVLASLPVIMIDDHQRIAAGLTKAIKEAYGIDTLLLQFSLLGSGDHGHLAILEVISSCWHPEDYGLSEAYPTDIVIANITESEMALIRGIIDQPCSASSEPFARIGWIGEALSWLHGSLPPEMLRDPLTIEQLNGGPTSTLLRINSADGFGYWIKAVGPQNHDEFTMTLTLATLFPNSLPTVISSRDDWRSWISKDAGHSIEDTPTLDALGAVVTSLADLHIRSFSHSTDLLKHGCKDLRESALLSCLPDLETFWIKAMAAQTSNCAPRLSERRIKDIVLIIKDILEELLSLNIPASLVHNDLNPGNILACKSPDGMTKICFIDWCEAFVANPFANFYQLLRWFQKALSLSDSDGDFLQRQYLIAMHSTIKEDTAVRLRPHFRVLSHLYFLCGGGNLTSRGCQLQTAGFESYGRTVARQIDRDIEPFIYNRGITTR